MPSTNTKMIKEKINCEKYSSYFELKLHAWLARAKLAFKWVRARNFALKFFGGKLSLNYIFVEKIRYIRI